MKILPVLRKASEIKIYGRKTSEEIDFENRTSVLSHGCANLFTSNLSGQFDPVNQQEMRYF